jgi:hypothetical protein
MVWNHIFQVEIWRNFASVRNTGLREVCFQSLSESEVPSQDDEGRVEGTENSGGVWKQTLPLHEETASYFLRKQVPVDQLSGILQSCNVQWKIIREEWP